MNVSEIHLATGSFITIKGDSFDYTYKAEQGETKQQTLIRFASERQERADRELRAVAILKPVSYTHLTLPTILRV